MHILWFLPPWGWIALLLAGVAGFLHARWVYRRTLPPPPPPLRRWLVGLRTAAVALLLLALAQPILLRFLPQRDPAVVAVVVEDSASMALADAPGDSSRWAAAWRLAADVADGVARGREGAQVIHLRGNGLGAVEPTDPAAALATGPQAVGTDLAGLLAQARQWLLGRSLRGLVLVADGNETDQVRLRAETPPPGGGPTWVTGLGDPVGPADRALTDLRYPEVAYRGETVAVEVAVADRYPARDAAQAPVTVTLRQGDRTLAQATRTDGGDLRRFSLSFTPAHEGVQVFTLDVSPLANERFRANNQVSMAMDVRRDRARVLLLAPRPDWDVRFLAQAAAAEPRLALEVARPSAGGPVLAVRPDSVIAWRPPADPAAWRHWDGVVLAGPPGAFLPDGGADLAQAVRDGLGLTVVAAPPVAGDATEVDALPPALADVLPVSLAGVVRRRDGVFVAAGADAARHPVLAGLASAGGGAALSGLPPLRGVVAATLRGDAQALLVAAGGGATQDPWPVLVAGQAQGGRVAWFGGWNLWELAFWEPPRELAARGPHPVRQMLRDLLLWTALGGEDTGVALVGGRLAYQQGERIRIAARWRDLRGAPVTDRLSVRLESEDGSRPPRTFTLQPDPAQPGTAAADLPALPPGRYRLTPVGGQEETVEGAPRSFVVAPATVEETQVRQDQRRLRQVAARAGARYVDAQAPAERAGLLAALGELDLAPAERRLERRWDLWSSWPYLAAVTALLAAEWILRRRHGML